MIYDDLLTPECKKRVQCKNGITGQNMPQTSNSLLSPAKSMVARGNQW